MKKLIFIIVVLCFAAGAQATNSDTFKQISQQKSDSLKAAKKKINDEAIESCFVPETADAAKVLAYCNRNEATFEHEREELSSITGYIDQFEQNVYMKQPVAKITVEYMDKLLKDAAAILQDKDHNPFYAQYHFEKAQSAEKTASSTYKTLIQDYNVVLEGAVKVLQDQVNDLNGRIENLKKVSR
ncbi:MAG: hypothetical protein FWF35_01620 [Elusimicrobia bacterium]|nr:hypothetical protein [Elusimicrobiota bacterium]